MVTIGAGGTLAKKHRIPMAAGARPPAVPRHAAALRCWRGAAEETFADPSAAAIADVVAVAGTADALLAPAGDKEYYDVYFQVAPKPASACCA